MNRVAQKQEEKYSSALPSAAAWQHPVIFQRDQLFKTRSFTSVQKRISGWDSIKQRFNLYAKQKRGYAREHGQVCHKKWELYLMS